LAENCERKKKKKLEANYFDNSSYILNKKLVIKKLFYFPLLMMLLLGRILEMSQNLQIFPRMKKRETSGLYCSDKLSTGNSR